MTTNYARTERAALTESLLRVGPDAPTLCEGWTTRDLAAHIVVRESRPDAAPGIAVPLFAGYTERVQARAATRKWTVLVGQLADGPPLYSPFWALDRWLNLSEMFVHHEDVLRGGVDPDSDWTPRALEPGLQDALAGAVRNAARMSMAKVPVRVTLRTTDGQTLARVGSGDEVTVTGTPGELLLFAFGRKPVQVAMDGSADAVAALSESSRGF